MVVTWKLTSSDNNIINRLDLISDRAYRQTFTILKKSNGKIYIAKLLKFLHKNEDQKRYDRRIFACIQILDSPEIFKPINFSKTDFDGNNCYVFIEKCMKNGSLLDLFKKIQEKTDIPEGWNNTKLIINILGISIGMTYLHNNGFIHQAIIPSNVLLDSKLYPKIADLENLLSCKDKNNGNPYYTAPDIHNDDVFSDKIDVFSFGMILYEFYSGCPPIVKGETIDQISRNIADGERHDENKLPEGPIRNLIKACLSSEPNMRPSFNEIICNYIENRDEYWPDEVDEEEVEEYLNLYGFTLDI